MKKYWIALLVFSVLSVGAYQVSARAEVKKPLYQVTVVQSAAKAINYRNLKGSVDIDFKGTVLLPDARGVAEVKNEAAGLTIEAEFKNLVSPNQFDPEYLTYILWAISPAGNASNLGELLVKDGKSEIKAKTTLQSLGLLVTAEPYFAVSQPSNVVVLENAIKPGNNEKIELVDAPYQLLPRGAYTKNISATENKPQAMDRKTPFAVYQARNAVRIARAAGAETYATEGFKNAERLLALAETKKGGKKGRTMTAREAIQSAEDARLVSVKRQGEDNLSAERARSGEQIKMANAHAAESAVGQAVAEKAQAQAESEKGVLRTQLLQQLNAVLQTRDSARGLIVNMAGSLFQTDSATLLPAVRERLAKIAGIVTSHPGLHLAVEGHTDSAGSEGYNQRLSELRAQAAREYLVKQGVPADFITSQGFGETHPVVSNDTTEGRSQNRRVEVVVSGDLIGVIAQER